MNDCGCTTMSIVCSAASAASLNDSFLPLNCWLLMSWEMYHFQLMPSADSARQTLEKTRASDTSASRWYLVTPPRVAWKICPGPKNAGGFAPSGLFGSAVGEKTQGEMRPTRWNVPGTPFVIGAR